MLSVNVAGTECYDVSAMGAGKGLAGPTCKTLAVYLDQRRRCREDVLLHECTPRFKREVLERYLGACTRL